MTTAQLRTSLMLAATTFAAATWFCAQSGSGRAIIAEPGSALADSDGDFLPDAVEWVVLTNPASLDTDGDSCPDFVEVVQRGAPRHPGLPRPMDHEMRAVVTAPSAGHQGEPTWLHLMFRFVGDPSLLSSFETWLQLPSLPELRIPLDVLSVGGIQIEQRQTATEGLWIRLSVPLVSEQVLRMVLPCSIQCAATIGGRQIRNGVQLFVAQDMVSTVTPFGDGRFVLQSLASPVLGPASHSNRVCVLELEQVGIGPGGAILEVVDADCESCNELECGPSCVDSIGWLIDVPGGIGSLGG